jgi:hypothetical protein
VGTATTDAAGAFTINLGPVTTALVAPVLYPVLRNQCSVAVTTPLATCNASLGSGTPTAPLQFLQSSPFEFFESRVFHNHHVDSLCQPRNVRFLNELWIS